MYKNFNIHSYRNNDEKKIVKLLDLVFKGWPHFNITCNPIEHWIWKHTENPLKNNYILVSQINDKIIGCLHRIPYRIKIGDKIIISYFGADLAVHPEFRRRGITKKMYKIINNMCKNVGAKILFFTTENPIMIKSYSKRYPRFPHEIVRLVRIRDISLHLRVIKSGNPLIKRIGFYTLKLINYFQNAFRRSESPNQNIRISETSKFDDRIDDFWYEVSKNYGFIVERSKNYLNWRYCDPRGGDYLIKIAEKDGRILGYSVLRINKYRENYHTGYIVDLLALPDRFDVVNALATDAVSHFDGQGINIVNYWVVKNNPYERILKRYGFLDSFYKFHMFIKPIEVELMGKLKKTPSKRLHFVIGDTDGI